MGPLGLTRAGRAPANENGRKGAPSEVAVFPTGRGAGCTRRERQAKGRERLGSAAIIVLRRGGDELRGHGTPTTKPRCDRASRFPRISDFWSWWRHGGDTKRDRCLIHPEIQH